MIVQRGKDEKAQASCFLFLFFPVARIMHPREKQGYPCGA